MRAIGVLLIVLLFTACSHQAKKVDCDKHLIAINPPTPVVKPDAAPKAPTP